LAWLALATVLSESNDGKNEGEAESYSSNVRQLAHPMSTHDALSPKLRTNRKLMFRNGSLVQVPQK
jgi:hypothetical protein